MYMIYNMYTIYFSFHISSFHDINKHECTDKSRTLKKSKIYKKKNECTLKAHLITSELKETHLYVTRQIWTPYDCIAVEYFIIIAAICVCSLIVPT